MQNSPMPSLDALSGYLAKLSPQQLQQYATLHHDDPFVMSLAQSVATQRKAMGVHAQQPPQQPTVAENVIADMGKLPNPQGGGTPGGVPQQMGVPSMPPAMQQVQPGQQQPGPMGMNGVAMQGPQAPQPIAHARGGTVKRPEDHGIGALPLNVDDYAEGGILGFATGGGTVGGYDINQALIDEGHDPNSQFGSFARAIYGQESGSGHNTRTSNRGAVGGMQVTPVAFADVADPHWSMDNPTDVMRAGVRYAAKGYNKAGGDPVGGGAFYYGGPAGLVAAQQGVAHTDPTNPKAPDTLQYGQDIADRMRLGRGIPGPRTETDQMMLGRGQIGEYSKASPNGMPGIMGGSSEYGDVGLPDIQHPDIASRAGAWMGEHPEIASAAANSMYLGAPGLQHSDVVGAAKAIQQDAEDSKAKAAAAAAAAHVNDHQWYHDPVYGDKDQPPAVTPQQQQQPGKPAGPWSFAGLSGLDLMRLGLGAMAGKSQYAANNYGEAGLAMLQAKQQQAYMQAQMGMMQSHQKYYEGMPQARQEAAQAQMAKVYETAQQQAMKELAGPGGFDPVDPAKLTALTQQYFSAMKANLPPMQQAPDPAFTANMSGIGSDPLGIMSQRGPVQSDMPGST